MRYLEKRRAEAKVSHQGALYLNTATGVGTVAGLSGQVADLAWLRDVGIAVVAGAVLVKIGNKILSWGVNWVSAKFEEIVALPAAIGTMQRDNNVAFNGLREDIRGIRLVLDTHNAADAQWKTSAQRENDSLSHRIAALENARGYTRRASDPGEPQT